MIHKTQESIVGALGISRAEFARWQQQRGWPGVKGAYDEKLIRAWARKHNKSFKASPKPKAQKPAPTIHIAGLTDDTEPTPAPPIIAGLNDLASVLFSEAEETALDAMGGNTDPLQEGRRIRNNRERIKLAKELKLVIDADRARKIANELGRAHVAMLQELPSRLAAHFPQIEAKVFRERCRSTLDDLRARNVASLEKILSENLGPEPSIETTLAQIKLTKDINDDTKDEE